MPVASLETHARRVEADAPETAERLIETWQYLHRVPGVARLVVVRTYETASGELFTRITQEPWPGL